MKISCCSVTLGNGGTSASAALAIAELVAAMPAAMPKAAPRRIRFLRIGRTPYPPDDGNRRCLLIGNQFEAVAVSALILFEQRQPKQCTTRGSSRDYTCWVFTSEVCLRCKRSCDKINM